MRPGLVVGHNVDRIDVNAGLEELKRIGEFTPESRMVIEYALQRWARGEEEQAERGAIDDTFHGIGFGAWRRVLAAARATAELQHELEQPEPTALVYGDDSLFLAELSKGMFDGIPTPRDWR